MFRLPFSADSDDSWAGPLGATLRACRPAERRRRRLTDSALVVLALMQDLQQHRGLSCALLGGQRGFRDDCAAVGEKLQRSLAAVAEPGHAGHDLAAAAAWQRVLGSWDSLRHSWRGLDFDTNLAVHSALVLDLAGILRELAETHRDALAERCRVIAEWPQMVEHLGMLRALGLRLIGTPDARADAPICDAFRRHLHEARSALAETADLIQGLPVQTLSEQAIARAAALRAQPAHVDAQDYHAVLTRGIDAWYAEIRTQLRRP
ncbi:MAG: nitrate- and nitrite sensing domain-containing protein [Gammaproteobacteria bacterium]|nr:nitrate- and nitrite sensing domain-containing protein [Gammaproteobacteria bacterium]